MDRSNTNNNNSDKLFQKINNKQVFLPMGILLGVLSIFTLILVFGYRPTINDPSAEKTPAIILANGIASNEQTVANVMIIVFFLILIVIFCIALLPNLKDVKGFVEQIGV